MYARSFRTFFLTTILCAMFLIPFVSHAQTQISLETTIRAALAGDPRTSGMSQAQIDAMVSVLSAKAQTQGVAPSDISWRPVSDVPQPAGEASSCGAFPVFLCAINSAFGFDDTDYTIPILLGLSSLLLVFFIAVFLERHYAHARALASAPQQQV